MTIGSGGMIMKRVLMMLVAGTVLSGLAAAYATTTRQIDAVAAEDGNSGDPVITIDGAEALAARD